MSFLYVFQIGYSITILPRVKESFEIKHEKTSTDISRRHKNFYSIKLVQYEGTTISELKLFENHQSPFMYNNVICNQETHIFSFVRIMKSY